MGVRLDSVCVTAAVPRRLADFWAGLLRRDAVPADDVPDEVVVPATDDAGLTLRFLPGDDPRTGPGRMHPELTTDSLDDQEARVTLALLLGATHLDVGQRPEEGHVVLADPEGNELCVLGPGNRFLDGCGLLATFSCDGTRAVGEFWSAALGWPLVWDHDEETAVQSPDGGPKLAWGGPPIAPRWGRNRWHLDLTVPATERDDEVARLVALGAVRVAAERVAHARPGVVVLTDPDDNELCVVPIG